MPLRRPAAVFGVNFAGGRRVALLLDRRADGDGNRVDWNGLDASGRPAPAGFYVARLETVDGARNLKLVRIP